MKSMLKIIMYDVIEEIAGIMDRYMSKSSFEEFKPKKINLFKLIEFTDKEVRKKIAPA
jgi:hypothetical protein